MTKERRAGNRFLLHSRVEITGVDDAGLQFAERTHLEDVGDLGCRFSLHRSVGRGGILGIEPLGRDGESLVEEFPRLFLIIWVERRDGGMNVGARSLRENELSDAAILAIRSASNSSNE
jgi:hypothetical protein